MFLKCLIIFFLGKMLGNVSPMNNKYSRRYKTKQKKETIF